MKKQWKPNVSLKIRTSQKYRKISNTKSKLKKKTGISRTGNKIIILQNWDEILLQIMEGDTNPVLTKIAGNNRNKATELYFIVK
nr:unnamed protein product [Callosobruchus analis]CAI5866036.1 unnamed protein product [Callosobruchus analis]